MEHSLAYKLGYNSAREPRDSINYQDKMAIPYNSFSHPKIQIPEYIRGWRDGKSAQL